MEATSKQWVEKYAQRLNEGHGDLAKLSSDERKHLRLLLNEYELSERLVTLQDQLSQGTLPIDET